MLTTVDNPWNPFTHWEEWFAYDTQMGHNTCGLIDRVCKTSNEISEADNELAIEQAFVSIVALNPKFYRILRTKEDFGVGGG